MIVWITLAVAVYITDKIGYDTLNQGLILETGIGLETLIFCHKVAQDYRNMQEKIQLNEQLEI